MEAIVPNLFVNDLRNTIVFYEMLGFKTIATVPETGEAFVWVMMAHGQAKIMFQTMESLGNELPEISRSPGAGLLFYIQLDDVRSYHQQIKDQVQIIRELETTFYGATEFSILDNNGYVLTFAQQNSI